MSNLSSIQTGSATLETVSIGGFTITDVHFPPSLFLPSHYHPLACFAIVLEGGVHKSFRAKQYEMVANQIVTMPPTERHWDRFSNHGARLLVIEPEELHQEQQLPFKRIFESANSWQNGRLLNTAHRILGELSAPDTLSELAIHSLVLDLFIKAARLTKSQQHPAGRPPIWLSQVRELLHDQFHKTMSLSELAAVASVHPVYLARLFRVHFGTSIGDYVRQLRLQFVVNQLEQTDVALSQLAQQAGFCDQSHLTRVFKQYKGVTPSQYRRALQN